MKYDVGGHLPSQVELLMVCFQKADIPGLERALSNIRNLVKDKRFQKALSDYDKQKLAKINEINDKVFDAAKTIMDAKSFSELYVDVEELKNDLIKSLESVELDYWDHVKDYITLYLNKEDVEEEDDGGGEQF